MTRRRDRMVGAFWLYVLAVFLATHWPDAKIPIPIARPDIIAHMTIFGLWTALCIGCGYFGRVWSVRNIVIAGLVSLAYSGFDEGTQAFRALNRVAAWDDFLANVAGVIVVAAGALVVARVRGVNAGIPKGR